jgi:uncharacterized protein (TIGR02588 family)
VTAATRNATTTSATDKRPRKTDRGRRMFAEWLSLGISLVILLGIAGFLLYSGMRANGPYLPCEAEVLIDSTSRQGERYVVPLRISNTSDRSMRFVRVVVTYPDGHRTEPVTRDIDVDYLAEKSEQTIYLYFDTDPRSMSGAITAKPQHYLLD